MLTWTPSYKWNLHKLHLKSYSLCDRKKPNKEGFDDAMITIKSFLSTYLKVLQRKVNDWILRRRKKQKMSKKKWWAKRLNILWNRVRVENSKRWTWKQRKEMKQEEIEKSANEIGERIVKEIRITKLSLILEYLMEEKYKSFKRWRGLKMPRKTVQKMKSLRRKWGTWDYNEE